MTYTIHTITGGVCYQATDASTLRDAVLEAVRSGASLSSADLSGAKLGNAKLSGADLSVARLSGANLRGANLNGADLSGASLRDAILSGASLRGANLSDASLSGAKLSYASLSGAILSGAQLTDAYLDDHRIHASSRVAFAGPVGDSDRTVFGYRAQANDDHKEPYLLLQCGCFIGDERAYRDRVAERYSGDDHVAHYEQCMTALRTIKAIVATWPITEEAAAPAPAEQDSP